MWAGARVGCEAKLTRILRHLVARSSSAPLPKRAAFGAAFLCLPNFRRALGSAVHCQRLGGASNTHYGTRAARGVPSFAFSLSGKGVARHPPRVRPLGVMGEKMNQSFAVLRVKPLSKERNIRGAARHNVRAFYGANVDRSRTYLNQVLRGTGDFLSDYRSSRFHGMKTYRQDGNRAAELVLTARSSWFDESFPGWQRNPEKLKPWLDACQQFLVDKYGENYISGVLHLDEESPHIHCMVVPTQKYKSVLRGKEHVFERISYHSQFGDDKWVFAKARQEKNPELTKLGKLQSEFAQAVGHLGLVRGCNSYTQKPRRHITTREYQAQGNMLNEKFAGELSHVQPIKIEIPKVGLGSVFQLNKIADGLRDAQEKLNAEIEKQNKRRGEIIEAMALSERRKKLLGEEQNRSAEIADLLRAHQKRARGIGVDLLAEIMHFTPGEKAVAQHFKKENPKVNAVDVLQKIRGLAAKIALDELTNACILRDIQKSGDVFSNEDSATFLLLSEYRRQAEKAALRKIDEQKVIAERKIREERAQKLAKIGKEKAQEERVRAEVARRAAAMAEKMSDSDRIRSSPSSFPAPDFG
ncbi:MAG: plasmid recombination protein [Pseudomonadota bacterium]|nr:plasmid recombination protein [Pseudomonadota bacterium]